MFRIEPRRAAWSNTVDVGNGPVALAVGEGRSGSPTARTRTVSRIDPATDAVTDTVPVGTGPTAIAVGEGAVWVANGGDGHGRRASIPRRGRTDGDRGRQEQSERARRRRRLGVDGGDRRAARAIAAARCGWRRGRTTSEARAQHERRPCRRAHVAAYDGLVSYRRAGGASYGSLVGDLATDVPEPSPDGRTYVFRLRKGIRLLRRHAGQPGGLPRVAGDAAAAATAKTAAAVLQADRGRAACVARPEELRPLQRASSPTLARARSRIHLTEPDPELLHELAFRSPTSRRPRTPSAARSDHPGPARTGS